MSQAGRDYLMLSSLSAAETKALIDRALIFKKKHYLSTKLQGRVLGLLFEKESTRTRISFEVAMSRLGGHVVYLSQKTSQLSRGETYADTAKVLSRYVDALVVRTFSQEVLNEMAQAASVPIINGLTDQFHPCQILADLMTVKERFKNYQKTVIAYLGDGNNMANSWIEASLMLKFPLRIACPKDFMPDTTLIKMAKTCDWIDIGTDPIKAVEGAHVINTDTWFSMGQKVSDAKRKQFWKFQVNKELLKHTDPRSIVLHCLPAHRGEEITNDVLDGPKSAVFDEAENRLYVQMALLDLLFSKNKK